MPENFFFIFWVPTGTQNGPKLPKISKKWPFLHYNAIKQIIVYPKILPTYIVLKNIAINICLRNLGTQNGLHLVKIWPKNVNFCILCMLKHENGWVKVIELKIMQGKSISCLGYLELAKNGQKRPKIALNLKKMVIFLY